MKNRRILLVSLFVVLILAVAVIIGVNKMGRGAAEGQKTFTVKITSERDSYENSKEYQSSEETLGAFLRTMEDCTFEESSYGIYIKGFAGMMEDLNQQYWWMVSVNGESATTGADEIMLTDGAVYSFDLQQGW